MRDDDEHRPERTLPEQRNTLTATPLVDAAEAVAARAWYLLVFDARGSTMHALPVTGEVVIGRASQSDLVLDDAVASRRHARLLLDAGEAQLEDLGSQNGTRVGGERLARPRLLASGDVITIGGAQLVFHREPRRPAARPLLDGAAFRQRIEAELLRSRRWRRPLALAAIGLDDAPEKLAGGVGSTPIAVDRPRVLAALAPVLRVLDAASWHGDDELLVVLPELDAREAGVALARALAAVSALHPRARAGLALSPEDGGDADSLLGVARAARATAPAEAVRRASDLSATRRIGQRTVVVADPAMVRLYALVERLAQSELSVLIEGETGAGKELVAGALHALSSRAAAPFVALNCAALAEALLESELFGHDKGAFTGAVATKIGLLESARGGTVLLDEVGELSAAAQAKLLRALETQRITRLGEVHERTIDTRIVAATHRDLREDVSAGRFRQDLYFRLAAARVAVPPLRDRARELSLLARVLLDEACARAKRPPLALSPAAMYALLAHRWPGNVRELRNAMSYVAATVSEAVVEPWHLPEGIGEAGAAGEAAGAGVGSATLVQPPPAPSAQPPADAGAGGFRAIDEEIRELEITRMTQALAAAAGVQTRAAELIGMPLRTFVTKVKLYGIHASSRGRSRGGAGGAGGAGGSASGSGSGSPA